jgi:hypothetical protein
MRRSRTSQLHAHRSRAGGSHANHLFRKTSGTNRRKPRPAPRQGHQKTLLADPKEDQVATIGLINLNNEFNKLTNLHGALQLEISEGNLSPPDFLAVTETHECPGQGKRPALRALSTKGRGGASRLFYKRISSVDPRSTQDGGNSLGGRGGVAIYIHPKWVQATSKPPRSFPKHPNVVWAVIRGKQVQGRAGAEYPETTTLLAAVYSRPGHPIENEAILDHISKILHLAEKHPTLQKANIVLAGDFNAHLGEVTRDPVTNGYGETLLAKAETWNLKVLGQNPNKPPRPTLVRRSSHPSSQAATKSQPSMIDLFLVRHHARVKPIIPGADCTVHDVSAGSDHRLVTCRVDLGEAPVIKWEWGQHPQRETRSPKGGWDETTIAGFKENVSTRSHRSSMSMLTKRARDILLSVADTDLQMALDQSKELLAQASKLLWECLPKEKTNKTTNPGEETNGRSSNPTTEGTHGKEAHGRNLIKEQQSLLKELATADENETLSEDLRSQLLKKISAVSATIARREDERRDKEDQVWWDQILALANDQNPSARTAFWRATKSLRTKGWDRQAVPTAFQHKNGAWATTPEAILTLLENHYRSVPTRTDPTGLKATQNMTKEEKGAYKKKRDKASAANTNRLKGRGGRQSMREHLTSRPSYREVQQAISSRNNNRAAGLLNSPYDIWKHGGEMATKFLKHIFDTWWTTSLVPDELNVSLTVLLPKPGESWLAKNYRPVSLIPCVQKIYEAILETRLTEHLRSQYPLSSLQFACRPGVGAIDTIDLLNQTLANNKKIIAASVDLSKAFDRIDHEILFDRLAATRIALPLWKAIRSTYLHERPNLHQNWWPHIKDIQPTRRSQARISPLANPVRHIHGPSPQTP